MPVSLCSTRVYLPQRNRPYYTDVTDTRRHAAQNETNGLEAFH